MAKDSVAIIACGIMKREIESVLGSSKDCYKVSYLSPAPCIDYSNMKRQLISLLRKACEESDRVLVVIGRCHPDIDEILNHFGAHRANINDCFDALLGGERKKLEKEANTFFTTAAWLDHWKRAFAKGMDYDEVDARQNMGGNERIVLIDTGLRPLTDEKILEYFDYTQVPIEVLPIDLTTFKALLEEEIDHLKTQD